MSDDLLKKTKTTKVAIRSTAWAEWVSYIGKERNISFGTEWDAKVWLCEQLDKSYTEISSTSVFTMTDVENFRRMLK